MISLLQLVEDRKANEIAWRMTVLCVSKTASVALKQDPSGQSQEVLVA